MSKLNLLNKKFHFNFLFPYEGIWALLFRSKGNNATITFLARKLESKENYYLQQVKKMKRP